MAVLLLAILHLQTLQLCCTFCAIFAADNTLTLLQDIISLHCRLVTSLHARHKHTMCVDVQVARLAGIEADIVRHARLAGQHIEDKLQVVHLSSNRSWYCSSDLWGTCPVYMPMLFQAVSVMRHACRQTACICVWVLQARVQLNVWLQVSFLRIAPGANQALLTAEAVVQLKHVLFACNASTTTFTQAWQGLQNVTAL